MTPSPESDELFTTMPLNLPARGVDELLGERVRRAAHARLGEARARTARTGRRRRAFNLVVSSVAAVVAVAYVQWALSFAIGLYR